MAFTSRILCIVHYFLMHIMNMEYPYTLQEWYCFCYRTSSHNLFNSSVIKKGVASCKVLSHHLLGVTYKNYGPSVRTAIVLARIWIDHKWSKSGGSLLQDTGVPVHLCWGRVVDFRVDKSKIFQEGLVCMQVFHPFHVFICFCHTPWTFPNCN